MKFKKKPIVVNATRVKCRMTIQTLEGDMVANPGDWLITGVSGEIYPCKDYIFRETYEPVDAEAKKAWNEEFVAPEFPVETPTKVVEKNIPAEEKKTEEKVPEIKENKPEVESHPARAFVAVPKDTRNVEAKRIKGKPW